MRGCGVREQDERLTKDVEDGEGGDEGGDAVQNAFCVCMTRGGRRSEEES